MKKPKMYCRKCSVTGKGMNAGYCFGDGADYAIDKEAGDKLCEKYGIANCEAAFEAGIAYWTEWNIDTDAEYYEAEDGELLSIEETDLFEYPELLPVEMQTMLTEFGECASYQRCEELQAKCKEFGFRFEYGLDAEPYELKVII